MSKSVMPAFAKNIRPLSGRRLATVAATAVLVGSVQLMTADTSWACGDDRIGGPHPATGTEHHAPGTLVSPDAALTSAKSSVVADGGWNEVSLKVTNKTGTEAHGMEPQFAIYTPGERAAVRSKDVRIQFLDHTGAWKNVPATEGCYRIIDAGDAQRQRMSDNTSVTFKFRFSLAPTTPEDVTTINLLASVGRAGAGAPGATDLKAVKVTRPQGTGAARPTAKPSATAKPATPKPAAPKPAAKPTGTAKPAPAEPVAAQTPAASPGTAATEAPAATPTTAPATTAPAGTPELAQTGAGTPNGLLAALAGTLATAGAAVLVAVRRLRGARH
ncbi:hypothetical protein ACWC5I_16275 [Kitasatospora sp. NPDC001574]